MVANYDCQNFVACTTVIYSTPCVLMISAERTFFQLSDQTSLTQENFHTVIQNASTTCALWKRRQRAVKTMRCILSSPFRDFYIPPTSVTVDSQSGERNNLHRAHCTNSAVNGQGNVCMPVRGHGYEWVEAWLTPGCDLHRGYVGVVVVRGGR